MQLDTIKSKKIQILRAFSIFAVVMIHSNAQGVLAVVDRPFLNFCVAMFIFLSGYLTKIDNINYTNFVKKRVKKVAIPYVIWPIIYSIIYNSGLLLNLLTGTACAPFYFILVYIQFVIITPLIICLLKSKYKNVGWIITPIFIIITRYIFIALNINFSYVATFCFAWFIYYYLGISLGNGLIRTRIEFKTILLFYLTSLILSECEGFVWFFVVDNFDLATSQIRITSIGTSFFSCILAFLWINNDKVKLFNKNFVNNLLISIGNYSFDIFFLHIAVIMVVRKTLSLMGLNFFPLVTILSFVISFIIACFYRIILNKILISRKLKINISHK